MANLFSILAALLMVMPLSAAIEPILSNKPIHEAFVPKASPLLPLPVSALQPPAPLPEKIPPQPEADLIWISGYWAWLEESNSYAWVCGVWRRPPPGMQWIDGEWINIDGGWTRLLGFWSPQPLANLPVIAQAPPELPQESPPQAPGQDFFYFKGYWEYVNGSYQYQPGGWQPFDANWILAQPSYYWRPDGYRFTPAYWDSPLDDRGYAYDCEGGNGQQFIVIEPQVIIQELYYCYPDYIPIYWHWWHYHPGYWDGCWCMPPWWGWEGWWGLGWHDQWGLWWWWAHPGFPAPHWMSAEFAQKIAPPQQKLIDFFKKAPQPFFVTPKGIPTPKDLLDQLDKPLLPKNPKQWDAIKDKLGEKFPKGPELKPDGKPGMKDLPVPKFPGEITPPKKPLPLPPKPTPPQRGIKLPPKPEIKKPQPQDIQPSYPDYPQGAPPRPNYPQTRPPKPQPDYPQTRPPKPQPDYPQTRPPKPQPDYPQSKPPKPQPDYPQIPPRDVTPPNPKQPKLPPDYDRKPDIKTFPKPDNRPEMSNPQLPSKQEIKDRIQQRMQDRGKKDDD